METSPAGDARSGLTAEAQREIPVSFADAQQLVRTVIQRSTRFRLQTLSADGAELTRRTTLARKAERISLHFEAAGSRATIFTGQARALDPLPGTDFGRGAKDLRLLFDALERGADTP